MYDSDKAREEWAKKQADGFGARAKGQDMDKINYLKEKAKKARLEMEKDRAQKIDPKKKTGKKH